MKKYAVIGGILLLSVAIFWLGFDYRNTKEPRSYYQVYLNDEILGTIASKSKLDRFIDKEGEYIKNKYNVDRIYAPLGLQVKRVNTFDNKLEDVSTIYQKISEREPFTVKGYQISIKNENQPQTIYVLDESVFRTAVEQLIITFVGKDRYQAYKNNTQEKIDTVGRIIENVYIEENMTIKETQIPITEKIYTDAEELSKYLLFGPENKQTTYTVQLGDTISKVAFNNEISTEEFLISNPQFTSVNNLLYPGQIVTIGITDPQLKVILWEHVVEDIVNPYRTEEKYDSDRLKGDDEVIQKGENGLERVTQKIKTVNGGINYVDPKGKEELKPTINEIIVRGEKTVPNVGSLKNWGWPTDSGWSISDDYEWRINPVTGARELHSGIDIAGNGYWAPVYATNNGTVENAEFRYDYGNYIVINHNNGYYTLYGHMIKIANNIRVGETVARGQIIGYVGSTGWSMGPHCHYEVWKGCRYCRISPWSLYR